MCGNLCVLSPIFQRLYPCSTASCQKQHNCVSAICIYIYANIINHIFQYCILSHTQNVVVFGSRHVRRIRPNHHNMSQKRSASSLKRPVPKERKSEPIAASSSTTSPIIDVKDGGIGCPRPWMTTPWVKVPHPDPRYPGIF